VVVDIGPTTPESTHYPKPGERRRGSSPLVIAGLASSYAAPAKAS
jgi:hypothetical protein